MTGKEKPTMEFRFSPFLREALLFRALERLDKAFFVLKDAGA